MNNYMLPPLHRIPSSFFLSLPRRSKRSFSGPLFSARWYDSSYPYSRIRVVTSTKSSRYAVQRNRMRRRVYAHIMQNKWHLQKGYDIVIYATSALVSASQADIQRELGRLFSSL